MNPQPRRFVSPLIIALALAGCGGHDRTAPAAAPARTVPATVETVALTRVPAHHAAPATLVAEHQAQVASRLMGHIRAIHVAEGQRVSAGQPLFSVDPVEVQGRVDEARAAVRQAEDALAVARLDYDRFEALLKEEVVTRQQYEKAKLQYDLAASRLAQARAGQAAAAGQLRYAHVAAPINGVVTRKLAHAGDLAAPGQPVLVLEDPARLQVETQVPEAVLRRLRPGQPVQVEVDGQDHALGARVARVSPAADPVSRTFQVKLDVAGAGLRSGLFARALFPAGEREVLSVPAAALVTRAGITGVFVVDRDGIARLRMVRAGAARAGRVEVQAGLEPGERVVTDGAERLAAGDKVSG